MKTQEYRKLQYEIKSLLEFFVISPPEKVKEIAQKYQPNDKHFILDDAISGAQKLFADKIQESQESKYHFPVQWLREELNQCYLDFHMEVIVDDEYYYFIDNLYNICMSSKIEFIDLHKLASNMIIYNDIRSITQHKARSLEQSSSSQYKQKLLAGSLRVLAKYTIQTMRGEAILSDVKRKSIVNEIEHYIKKSGALNILNFIFGHLEKYKYSDKLNRYILDKSRTNFFGGNVKVEDPFNFIINLALKHIHKKLNPIYEEVYAEKVFELSKAFINLYGLQTFGYEEMFKANNHLWDTEVIKKDLLYDHCFRFQQMQKEHLYLLLEVVFENVNQIVMKEKLGFTVTEYISLVKKIYNFNTKIFYLTSLTLDEQKIIEYLSHQRAVNQNYILPTELYKTKENSFFSKPLIKYQSGYLLLDHSYCAFAFYEALLIPLLRIDSALNSEVGIKLEKILIEKAQQNQCIVHYGKYQFKDGKKGNNIRESDLIIETDEYIMIIEVKKKAFTKETLLDDNSITVDSTQMFISAQKQAFKHELFLRDGGEMCFKESKSKLKLAKQDIFRISISLYDVMSLGTPLMLSSLIDQSRSLKFSHIQTSNKKQNSKNTKLAEALNKTVEEYKDDIELMYKGNEEEYRKHKFHSFHLSYDFFLFLLDKHQDKFSNILKKLTHVTYGSGDIISEYYQRCKMENIK